MKGLKIEIHGDTFLTRERKTPTTEKPLYFLWNLTRKEYGSSLFPLGKNLYSFDLKTPKGRKPLLMEIDSDGNIRVKDREIIGG